MNDVIKTSNGVSCHFYPAEMCPLDELKCRENGYCPRQHALLPALAPPSIALALMAWRLAQLRAFPDADPSLSRPVSRANVDDTTPASTEYYHLLRRIEDGEAP